MARADLTSGDQRGAARELNSLPRPRNALVVDSTRNATRQAVRSLAENGAVVHFMSDKGALNRRVEEIWDGGGRIVAVDDDDLNHRPLERLVQDTEQRLGPIDLIFGAP